MDHINGEELNTLKPLLEKEISIHTNAIKALYRTLDKKFGLYGADLPITFGYETETLGSYTPSTEDELEHFHFSLALIGYALKQPLKKADRTELFKHEYAHYMAEHIDIPAEYRIQPGKHGSAWRYCCSLIGAAPSQGFYVGKGSSEKVYDDIVTAKPLTNRDAFMDAYKKAQEDKAARESRPRFQPGDEITHPRYGTGIIESLEQTGSSVRLCVRFGEAIKKIDQQWLLKVTKQQSL